MTEGRFQKLLIVVICVGSGIANGLSYPCHPSNHQTYLLHGIHLINQQFLATDWWVNNTTHYHWAFSYLVAFLVKLNILPWGLAVLNILLIALTLYICYLLICNWITKGRLFAFCLIATFFLLTRAFFGVAWTYLFSPSLQPSNIATFTTLSAIYFFANARYAWTGILLCVGGIFHTNFLLVNFSIFGLAYFFKCIQERKEHRHLFKSWMQEITSLLGPSALIIIITLPLIFKITGSDIDEKTVDTARFALFEFGAPIHYLPRTFLFQFVELLGWQLIGIACCNLAIGDLKQRRIVWALQISMIVILWCATALTTIIFIEPVSRMFFWRIAPFSALLSAILLIAGAIRSFDTHPPSPKVHGLWPILLSGLGIILIATYHWHTPSDPFGTPLLLLIVFCLIISVAVQRFRPDILLFSRKQYLIIIGIPLISLAGFLTWIGSVICFAYPNQYNFSIYRSRYSLVSKNERLIKQNQLYRFVRENTPLDSQFLVPPNLISFRLMAERAIVADTKAMPLDKKILAQWYQRLELISGLVHPLTMKSVNAGYHQMDPDRLNMLQRKYALTHVVLLTRTIINDDNWKEIFNNNIYHILEYCPQP